MSNYTKILVALDIYAESQPVLEKALQIGQFN